jgi:hypothetical protein
MSGSNGKGSAKKLEVDVHDLPWAGEDYAFDRVASALMLTEDAIDRMSSIDRHYHINLVVAVGSFSVRGLNNGELFMLPWESILGLHQRAQAETAPVTFLQAVTLALQDLQGIPRELPTGNLDVPPHSEDPILNPLLQLPAVADPKDTLSMWYETIMASQE